MLRVLTPGNPVVLDFSRLLKPKMKWLLGCVLLLLFSVGALMYEAESLRQEIHRLEMRGTPAASGESAAGIAPAEGEQEEAMRLRMDRIFIWLLVLMVGLTVMSLLIFFKSFLGVQEPDEDELMASISTDLDELERLEDAEAPPKRLNDALMGAGEDPLFPEVDDPHQKELESSYTKMMAALQKINDLEKRHTIELAEANKRLEKEVAERELAEKEIRRLSRKLIDGIEEAQKGLARDLHDEFGQTLAALHMGVEAFRDAVPDEMSELKDRVQDLVRLIEQLGDKIRNISSDLRPDLLDDLGLVPTLQWHISEFMAQHPKIQIAFQAVGFKKRLAPELELVFYRIFQESLNNIVKHAKARHVDVMLTHSHPEVILMVKDDGVGFDTQTESSGIGLIGMRERAVSANGFLEIRSEIGKGTAIRAALPVS